MRLHFSTEKKKILLLNFFEAGLMVTLVFLAATLTVLSPAANSAAGVINKLSYQGKLLDVSGNPVGGSGTNYCFRFSLYDAATGGSQIWPSGTPTTSTVQVVNGVFNAEIGTADTLNYDFYPTSTVYLNVEVSNSTSTCTAATLETLSPRQQILATGYAIAAENLYGDVARTDVTNRRLQLGTGAGAATTSIQYLALDVANVSQTIGAACSPNGTLWYNSNASNTETLVCENGLIENVVNAGSPLDTQTFNASGTWSKPSSGNLVKVQMWGAGGSGGRGGAADAGGGGGGGGYLEFMLPISSFAGTETCTVGSGGNPATADEANGNPGGNTTFTVNGTTYTVYGGGAGCGSTAADCGGGGGGGAAGAGAIGTSAPAGGVGGTGGGAGGAGAAAGAFGGPFGGGGGTTNGGYGSWGGGGGGLGNDTGAGGVGGGSVYGGGGGGGGSGSSTTGAGGNSIFGGDGGAGGTNAATGTSGTQPGGGGGGSESANSGAGGSGRCVVTTY